MKKKRKKRHCVIKAIFRLLIVLVCLVLGVGAFFGVKGYEMYQDAIAERTLDERVEDVDTCLFDIRDTGCGIDDTRLTMLNNGTPISSTQEESNSTDHGLGLKIVRQIVKAHGGKIYFSSTVPHGLSVKIELPVNGKMLEWYK